MPVNPALGVAETAEAGLAKLKELYGGSMEELGLIWIGRPMPMASLFRLAKRSSSGSRCPQAEIDASGRSAEDCPTWLAL